MLHTIPPSTLPHLLSPTYLSRMGTLKHCSLPSQGPGHHKTKTTLVYIVQHLLCVQPKAGPIKTGTLATSALSFTCCELWGPAPGSRSELGSSQCLSLSTISKFITNVHTILSPTGEGWNQRPSPSPVESKEDMSLAEHVCAKHLQKGGQQSRVWRAVIQQV